MRIYVFVYICHDVSMYFQCNGSMYRFQFSSWSKFLVTLCFTECMFQVHKLSNLMVLKSSSNLKKHKNLIMRCMKKGRKKMELDIVELGTYHLVFAKWTKCWSFFSVASNIVQFFSFVDGNETSLLELEELSMIVFLLFTSSFLVALDLAFVLLVFTSNSFHICVQVFFLPWHLYPLKCS